MSAQPDRTRRNLRLSASRTGWRRVTLLAGGSALALLVACDDAPPAGTKKPAAAPAAGAGGAAAPKPAAAPVAAAPVVPTAEKLRRKPLKEEDFFESETNRDPFRSFIEDLNRTKTGPIQSDVKVYFKDYGCEEIKLIAIISGGLNPHAMFRDPRGIGLPIRVGDRICRSQAKVIRIVQDSVIVETEEDLGGAKTRPVQKKIPINTDELLQLPSPSQ
jgi:type IV pilus assembly protein PilP